MADVNKEIALKVTTDTTQTQKAFANAQQELEATRKALVDLALAGKQGTAEFEQMEKRAGQLQDAIGDVNRRVTNLANDTPKLQILGEAATAIAGGFALAQGAAVLFGDENEEVQKAIMKTQAAMSLLNGVQSVANSLNKDSALMMNANAIAQKAYSVAVGTSTGALKLFRLALISTGIGAAVVAIGALVANFDKVKAAVMGFIEASAPLKAVIDFISRGFNRVGEALGILPSASEKATKQMIADLEKQKKLLEASGADTAALDKRLAELRVQLAKQTGEGLAEAEEELTLTMAAQNKQRADKAKEADAKRIEQQISALENQKAIAAAAGQEVFQLDVQIAQKRIQLAKKTNGDIAKAEADLQILLINERTKGIERQKEIDQIAIDVETDKAQAAKDAADKLAEIQNDIRRNRLTDYQREREDFLLQRQQMLELMKTAGASEIEQQLFVSNTNRMIQQMDAEKERQTVEETEQKKFETRQRFMQKTGEMTMMALGALQSLYTANLGESEKEQKKAFEANKKFSIAQALISTFLAVNNALTAGGNPIKLATGAQFVEAGIALTAGLANVLKIRNTQFQSSSASSQSGRPAGGLPQGISQPPAAFNPNVSNPIFPPQGQGGAGQPQGQRVYVLERDIRNVGQRVSAVERFATFG